MNELVILIGLPGSGKSTYVNNNLKTTHHILCLDDIRIAMGSTFNINVEPFVKATAEIMGRALMIRGVNIVLDSTNVSKYITKQWIEKSKEFGYKTKLIIFDVPIEICKERQTHNVPNDKLQRFVDQMNDIIENLDNLGATEIQRV